MRGKKELKLRGKKELKNVDLRVKMSPSEYAKVEKEWKESIYNDRSEYLRMVLRKKPVVNKYRNQSLDDLLEVLVGLKSQLEGLGRSLLPADVEYLKSMLIKIYEKCVQEG
ncbi:MAG TPA: hypothetical protein VGM89_20010, partial [Puia sp.]